MSPLQHPVFFALPKTATLPFLPPPGKIQDSGALSHPSSAPLSTSAEDGSVGTEGPSSQSPPNTVRLWPTVPKEGQQHLKTIAGQQGFFFKKTPVLFHTLKHSCLASSSNPAPIPRRIEIRPTSPLPCSSRSPRPPSTLPPPRPRNRADLSPHPWMEERSIPILLFR